MSFIITIHVGEGFVMASDSRITFATTEQTDSGKQVVRHGTHISDTTYKTFLTSANVGISTCGDSSLNGQLIVGFIERYINSHKEENVDEIKDSIRSYFRALKSDLNTTFIIVGYVKDKDGRDQPKCYKVNIAEDSVQDFSDISAVWDGEKSVISRLTSTLYIKQSDDTYIKHSENDILWNYFTLQDAIDFARYAVQVTIDTMKFQRTVKTVGGPIDILVIQSSGGRWINRKELK